jgi:ribosomal protein S2
LGQNAGEDHKLKIGNKCSENIVKFRYLGAILTNQDYIPEKFKSKMNSVNT